MFGFDLKDLFSFILVLPFIYVLGIELWPVMRPTQYKPEDLVTYR